MASAPYTITTRTLVSNVPEVIRGATRFVALVSASLDATDVEVSIGDSDSWQPLLLGLIPSEFPPNVDRIAVRSPTAQVVEIATGSAMVYDTRQAPGSTTAFSLVDLGGNGLGQEVKASSLSVTLASDQGNLAVAGAAADGAAVAGNPVLVAGQDGANVQTIKTDTTGRVEVIGAAADGAAVAGNPVLVAGQDGTNAQSLRVDTNGRPEMVGPVAAGSAISTHAPVMVGGSDGTNVQRLRVDTTGRPLVVGPVAHDSAVSTDAPLMISAEARSTERAAVASADVARLVTDLVGKLVTLPYTIPETMLRGQNAAAMTGMGDTSVIAAQGASVRIYVTTLTIVNSHATVGTEVAIKDGATEMLRVYVPPLNGTAGPSTVTITLPVPLRLTANTALNAANITTGSNTWVSAVGYRGA